MLKLVRLCVFFGSECPKNYLTSCKLSKLWAKTTVLMQPEQGGHKQRCTPCQILTFSLGWDEQFTRPSLFTCSHRVLAGNTWKMLDVPPKNIFKKYIVK